MGILAKTGIIDGKKVTLSRKAGVRSIDAELSPFDEQFLQQNGLVNFFERLQQADSFSSDEIASMLNSCSLPMLLKLVGLLGSGSKEIRTISSLYLPVDGWLDKHDPLTVIKRALRQIRRQREVPKRLFIEIKDFSDLEHLWPDIIDELRSSIPEDVEIVGPEPKVLMDWINRNDSTGSRTVRRYQFEMKIARLLDAGFDRVLPTSQSSLLMHIQEAGFPVEAQLYLDEVSGNEELARKLVRVKQNLMGEVELSAWMPTIRQDRRASIPQAAIDLLIIRSHLIGSLVYPQAQQLVDGSLLSEAGIDFLKTAGIEATVQTTSDPRTAEIFSVLQVGSNDDASILAGSF